MVTRQQALEILHDNMESQNLRRHCYAVAAVMEALAKKLGGDTETSADAEAVADKWYIAGLLHDADYEKTKENTQEHTKMVLQWLENHDVHQDVKDAILAHGWGFVEGNPQPQTPMQWALYCCDELTGFIVAVALVRPERKLSAVTTESVLKKWPQMSFAAGVHRPQVELCEEKLGIPLPEFVTIALSAMQEKSEELGL